ncbi:hypothetical protein HMPREF9186_00445 [Streptococcus sp. F0442]|jgi:hypothetical protein|uniref:Imm6 family immunity protein n=1 Tax=Streptococcus sp. F0442 TaxID=999425 RepID=UPI0002992A33|nr:Imm6 family immunity protein [Streptococcus sp. F0442]EKS20591.1 hypothetical protein HMPREF9186_00445 [Streptococcus sp. F0442]
MFDSYLMLTFSEAIAHQLSSPYNFHIRIALDACWSFLEKRDKNGDELYALLDDSTDFGGLFIFMQLDDNESHVASWDNMTYAIATTAKAAYSFANKKEIPSPLENIDDSLIEIFIENLKEINSNFYEHVQDVKDFLARDQLPSKEEALKELERMGLLL